jgi:photosystem II stability/assembly factor-like uncharacterized protein
MDIYAILKRNLSLRSLILFLVIASLVLTSCGSARSYPNPVIEFYNAVEADEGVYLGFTLQNYESIPKSLFAKYDDILLCGRENFFSIDDQINSRTWMEFYDADSDSLIYADTRFTRSTFGNFYRVYIKWGDVIPKNVYLVLRDRKYDKMYRSNTVSLDKIDFDKFIKPSSGWKAVYSNPGGISLADIIFTSATEGWAAGGQYSHTVDSAPDMILHTQDGGDSWTLLPTTCGEGIYDLAFDGSSFGMAVSGNGLAITRDGGQNWSKVKNDEWSGLRSGVLLNAQNGYVGGLFNKVIKSSDHGATWVDVSPNLFEYNGMHFEDVDFIDDLNGWVSGNWYKNNVDFSEILHTGDGGKTWEIQYDEANGKIELDFVDGQNGWAAASKGFILNTTDGGKQWNVQYQMDTARLTSIFFENASRGWVGGDGGVLLQTEDGGKSWNLISVPSYSAITSIFLHSGYLYITNDMGNILRNKIGE